MNPGLSFVRVMDSEFIKFRTLRSSWVMLLSGVLALFGLGLLGGWNAGRNANLSPGDVLPSWMLEATTSPSCWSGYSGCSWSPGSTARA